MHTWKVLVETRFMGSVSKTLQTRKSSTKIIDIYSSHISHFFKVMRLLEFLLVHHVHHNTLRWSQALANLARTKVAWLFT